MSYKYLFYNYCDGVLKLKPVSCMGRMDDDKLIMTQASFLS